MFFSVQIEAQILNFSKGKPDTSDNTILSFDFNDNTFQINKYEKTYSDDVISISFRSEGSMIKDSKNMIICIDKISKKKYKFKFLSEKIILNSNIPYMADTLYLISKKNHLTDRPLFIGGWKNGIKEGYWHFYTNEGKHYYKLYKEGVLIETNEKKSEQIK